MTPCNERIYKEQNCNDDISLADESTVVPKSNGTRSVKWGNNVGDTTVTLRESLVVPDMRMSLLSIAALCNKKPGTKFLSFKAILFHVEKKSMTLRIAKQREDGLFYIPYSVTSEIEWNEGHCQGDEIAALMAVAKREYAGHDCRDENTSGTQNTPNASADARCDIGNASKTESKRQSDISHLLLGHASPIKDVIRSIREGLLPRVTCKEPAYDSCAKRK